MPRSLQPALHLNLSRLIVFFVVLIVLAMLAPFGSANAQDLRDLRERFDAPAYALLNPDNPQDNVTKEEMVALYFEACRESSASKDFQPYMDTQCACTAAEMDKTMSRDELFDMFENTSAGNIAYARLLLLSYIPCIRDTVKDYVVETCVFGIEGGAASKRHIRFCACQANIMGDYAADNATSFIPGIGERGINVDKLVPNPLLHVLQNSSYQRKYNHQVRFCEIDTR